MFEGNSLSVTYHLRDLERQFGPQLREYGAETATLRSHTVASLLAFVLVALSLGTACLI